MFGRRLRLPALGPDGPAASTPGVDDDQMGRLAGLGCVIVRVVLAEVSHRWPYSSYSVHSHQPSTRPPALFGRATGAS